LPESSKTITCELKESIIMRRVCTTCSMLLAVALAVILMPGPVARAGIMLAVGDPETNGVVAIDGSQAAIAVAADSPGHAIAGNARSSIHLLGSQIAMSFEVDGSGIASTGFTPSFPNFGAIPITIEATSGEAAGTPVTIQLQGLGNVPPDNGYTDLFIGQTLYPANQQNNITGFSVGDTFYFWGGLTDEGGGDYTMTVTLSAQLLGSAVPEPSSLLLISAGLSPVPVFIWRLRRRGKRVEKTLSLPAAYTG
jgi:hypothetical protein